MKIKARLASLKSEALRKEAGLRATLEKAVLERRELKSQLVYAKGETRSKRRNIVMKKRGVEVKNKQAIVDQSEADKKRIAASQRRLAKIKMDALTMEAKLTARLKAALDESKQFKHALESQKQKYNGLNGKFSAWRSKQEKKHNAMISREKKKYESLHHDLEEHARSCSALLKATHTEITTLEAKFKEAMTLLAKIVDTKEKRSKARELIATAESKLNRQNIKISMATAKRAQLCEVGTPGPALRHTCEQLAREIADLQKAASQWQSEISTYEVTFSSH
jgi:chromosome segregation ATPase